MKDLSNENIIHIKKNGIQYIQFKKLLEYQDVITHCFTLKELDFGSNDTMKESEEKYIENYKKICTAIDVDYNKVIRPYQTHTDKIKSVHTKIEKINIFQQKYTDVDGLITNKNDMILSLVYADCIPLYFFDPVKRVIANIHSGWKGTLKRIGVKAVQKMIEEYGCSVRDIICCIGPSIRKCHFQVDEDVYKYFKNEFADIESEVIGYNINRNGAKKYSVDTIKINQIILKEMGLREENIIESGICSVCNSDLIYSYREEKEKAGRNTAIIMIK